MSRIGRTLAQTIFDIRFSRGAVPDAFPGYERNPAALATDLQFKRWARLAGWFGADLSLLAALCGTDKFGVHQYTPIYEEMMGPVRRRPVSLLELGVGGYDGPVGGESLLMWEAYFPKGQVFGIDIADKTRFSAGRIKVFQCSQTDRVRLTELCQQMGPFDFVIDDASHVSSDQIESFRILWPFLKDRGSYIIEDVQTSYSLAYGGGPRDSPAYQRSCLNYFKGLVDSVNAAESISLPGEEMDRTMSRIAFHQGMIVITKAPRVDSATPFR